MDTEHFTVAELAPGVYGCVAGTSQAAVGNAAIIDTGDKTIVVDSFMTTVGAAELRACAEALTGRTVSMLVNSHWHGDHTYGNQVFADTAVVSTAATARAVAADAPSDLDAYRAQLGAAAVEFETMLTSDDEDERNTATRRLQRIELLRNDSYSFKMTPPNLLIEKSLVIDGERPVEILTYGGGHTDSDVFVWLPEDRVIVAGDLCFARKHPRMVDAHPGSWAEILRGILRLRPRNVMPGHGPPGDEGLVEALIPYFEEAEARLADYDGDWADVPLPGGTDGWEWDYHYREGLAAISLR